MSVSQAETILGQLADLLALESAAPGSVTAIGNDGRDDAPRGVFPCAGDDEWCVVLTIRDDADWARLTAVIGDAEAGDDGAVRGRHRPRAEGGRA